MFDRFGLTSVCPLRISELVGSRILRVILPFHQTNQILYSVFLSSPEQVNNPFIPYSVKTNVLPVSVNKPRYFNASIVGCVIFLIVLLILMWCVRLPRSSTHNLQPSLNASIRCFWYNGNSISFVFTKIKNVFQTT